MKITRRDKLHMKLKLKKKIQKEIKTYIQLNRKAKRWKTAKQEIRCKSEYLESRDSIHSI